MAKTELAVQNANTGLAVAADFMQDMLGQGTGLEGTDSESFAIPFLHVLQKMSPAVDEDDGAYIQGAKPGMLVNTVTKKLLDGKAGFDILPVAYKRSFILWGSREGGEGGFKGEFTPAQMEKLRDAGEVIEIGGRLYKPDSNGKVNEKTADRYTDTRTHFVIAIDPETGETTQAILALASTQVKQSRMLMTMLSQRKVANAAGQKVTPPTFANRVRLTTISQSNEKGTWHTVNFVLGDLVTDRELFMEAKAFYDAVASGAAKADHERAANATGGDGAQQGKSGDSEDADF